MGQAGSGRLSQPALPPEIWRLQLMRRFNLGGEGDEDSLIAQWYDILPPNRSVVYNNVRSFFAPMFIDELDDSVQIGIHIDRIIIGRSGNTLAASVLGNISFENDIFPIDSIVFTILEWNTDLVVIAYQGFNIMAIAVDLLMSNIILDSGMTLLESLQGPMELNIPGRIVYPRCKC